MGIHTIVAGTCANCTGYGATYAAAGALMLVGAPAYTFLTEKKIERKMAKPGGTTKPGTTQEGR